MNVDGKMLCCNANGLFYPDLESPRSCLTTDNGTLPIRYDLIELQVRNALGCSVNIGTRLPWERTSSFNLRAFAPSVERA